MTEYEYEVYQRKVLARQSRYRKCGSKSKRCTLPSDRLTDKQWKERNGAIMQYDFNSPMSYAAFKEMPVDLQSEYVSNLVSKHGATCAEIAKMFGVTASGFSRYVSNKKLGVVFDKYTKRNPEQKKKWQVFIGDEQTHDVQVADIKAMDDIHNENEEEVEIDAHEEVCHPVEDAPALAREDIRANKECSSNNSKPDSMAMDRLDLCFSGKINVDAISNSLKFILGDSSYGRVQIICVLE